MGGVVSCFHVGDSFVEVRGGLIVPGSSGHLSGQAENGAVYMGGVHFRDWSLITFGGGGGGDKRHHRARAFPA